MTQRSFWWLAIAMLLGCALLLGRSCGRDGNTKVATSAIAASGESASHAASTGANAAAQKTEAGRQQAISRAVDSLHRYIAALSAGRYAEADAFWTNGRPEASSNEADLRALKDLRSMRIQNDAPKPLDSESIPAALEIPIELRIGTEGRSARFYRGWYRMRSSNPAQGGWKITSASVKAETR